MLMFLATGLAMASSAVEPQAARRDQLALDQMRHYAPYRAAVQGAYQKYEEALSGHCPSIDLDQATARARVELPLEVNEQGHIVNGTFSGVVVDADDHEYTINGKFSALRVN